MRNWIIDGSQLINDLFKLILQGGCVKFSLMSKNKAVILFIIFFLITGNVLITQEDIPVVIIANNKERLKEIVIAKGNVEIHYKDIILFADWAQLNTETKDVYARGNVAVHMPDEFISGEEIHINLESSEGELKKGFGRVQPTVSYEAINIERKDANLYRFRKARITSCTQPNPRWRFSASKANIKKDDYIEMWNAVFFIKKIPIFYFPYFRYPLREDKSTGLLTPNIGYTSQKGFSYTQGFYWDIKQLNLYGFQFKSEPGQETSPDAYLFRFNHKQTLPLKFNLVADVDYSSSFDFLREFDNDFKRAVVSNRRSQVYLSKSWSYFNFSARLSRFETYSRTTDTSVIRHTLPEIAFKSSKIKLLSPLYFSFNSSFRRWEYGNETQFEAGTQMRSQSASFQPQLTLPFTLIPWFTLNSTLYSNLTYHFQSYAPGTSEVVDEPLFIPEYGLNVGLTGPVFYKVFYDAKNEPKLKHLIEPNFSFRYESPIDDPGRIIDYRRYFRYHQISYGLTNRLLVKKGKMPREIFSLGLKQTFYLSPEDSPLSLYRIDGEIPKTSDISAYLRFYPARKYSLDLSGAYNPHFKTFSHLRVRARYGSSNDNMFLSINWYKSINPYYEGVTYSRHQIGLYGGIKIPRLSLETEAEMDYNIQEKELLYTGLALVYNYQCIDIRVEVKVFYFRERPETQFNISFGLGNIGKTTGFFSGLGF